MDPEWFISDLVLPFSWFRILHEFFNNFLNINFTFVFPSCKCYRLHIMARCKIFRKIFWTKRNARIRNDLLLTCIQIRILLKVLDPTGSGSTTMAPVVTELRSDPDPGGHLSNDPRRQIHIYWNKLSTLCGWRSPCFWSCLAPLNSPSRNASGPVYNRI